MKNFIKQTLFIGCNIGSIQIYTTTDIVNTFNRVTGVSDFTVTTSTGYYQGSPEKSVIITIIDENIQVSEVQIQTLADELKQECILHTVEKIKGNLIWNTEYEYMNEHYLFNN